MEKRLARTKLFWKSLMFIMMVTGFIAVGYTVGHVDELPQLPDEMIMPLIAQKTDADSTRKLIDTFSQIRTLSEDYLIERKPENLMVIGQKLDQQLNIINQELQSLADTDDTGMEILVGNLIRLKGDFEKDMRLAFKLHRMELGLKD